MDRFTDFLNSLPQRDKGLFILLSAYQKLEQRDTLLEEYIRDKFFQTPPPKKISVLSEIEKLDLEMVAKLGECSSLDSSDSECESYT